MDLDELRSEVFELYEKHEYEQALVVARAAVDEFPANASYWVACLLAVTHDPEGALDALDEGLARGGWWPPAMLVMDPDLDSIRDSERFADVTARSENAWKKAFKAAPEIHIYPPTSEPSGALLVALHGMPGDRPDTFAGHWTGACEHGAVVVVPESSQPHTPEGGRCWVDDERTDKDLRLVCDEVISAHAIDPSKVVLCGFSQGGRVAITRSLAGAPFETCGFIAVAPAVADHQLDGTLTSAGRSLRGVFVIGTDDFVFEPVRAFHSEGAEQGFEWRLHEVRDLGHEFPEDFSARLIEAMRFVLA
ncbi:MAG TPA: hypothetical protein VG929_05685 [Actinomycetota bacterium]|nr:hypothetical protein [Actinomycetota bacterium]